MAGPDLDDPQVFTLQDGSGLQIQVCDLGAAWLSCRVPMADGPAREVLLAHPHPRDLRTQAGYLGVVVGRYANRIAGSRIMVDGRSHVLVPNEGTHHLHGGPDGFHRRRWQAVEHGPGHVRLRLDSPDGDQGHPGHLVTTVEYRLSQGAVGISFQARTDAPCAVGPTSHAYFNLDGDARCVLDHRLQVRAAEMVPVDDDRIPTGGLRSVEGSAFDLRQGRRVGSDWDHCLALDASAGGADAPAAVLTSGDGLLSLQMHTNYPGLQVYAGRHLAGLPGRHGRPLAPHAGLALEPQFFPDAPNHAAWRDQGCILRPGELFSRWIRVTFQQAPCTAS